MILRYVCYYCNGPFALKGVIVDNGDGNKTCYGCMNNNDDLTAVDAEKWDRTIEKWKEEHKNDVCDKPVIDFIDWNWISLMDADSKR